MLRFSTLVLVSLGKRKSLKLKASWITTAKMQIMLTRNQPLFGVQQRRTIFKVTWVFLENLDWSGVFLESNQQKPFLATGDVAQVSDRVARAFNQTSYLAKRLH